MGIIWDPDKESKLLAERDIDIREVAGMIVSGDYLVILAWISTEKDLPNAGAVTG